MMKQVKAVALVAAILFSCNGYLENARHIPLLFVSNGADHEITANNGMHLHHAGVKEQQQDDHPTKRDRVSEESAVNNLMDAFKRVKSIIQQPLGGSNKQHLINTTYMVENNIRPLNTSFRGVELTPALRVARILYLITPTYTRQTQMIDLMRLSQTLRLAIDGGYHQRLYWILLEENCTQRVRQVALDSGIPFAHVHVKKLNKTENPNNHRGVEQRNAGLQIVERVGAEGVVYFMDDDNAYNVQLFHELPYTTHVSVFGVGMVGGGAYERCHVDPATGKVDELLAAWKGSRKFPMDMAGFAFASHHLERGVAHTDGRRKEPLRFSLKATGGYLEDAFLKQIASTVGELEPLAANCTRIFTYHVKTQADSRFYNPERNNGTFDLIKALV